MNRYCPCGKTIGYKQSLCKECAYIYGSRSEWPAWLKFYVADIQREIKYDRTHDDLDTDCLDGEEIDDSYELNQKLSRI